MTTVVGNIVGRNPTVMDANNMSVERIEAKIRVGEKYNCACPV